MAIAKLNKAEWQGYFDAVSRALVGRRAELDVESSSLGSQVQGDSLPLLGLSYDPKDDTIEIFLEGLDRRISHPGDVFVDREGINLTSLEVVDQDNQRLVMKLREPLMLGFRA